MCRALKVLCAAPTPERLGELKRAAVSAQWELVGGATSVEELGRQVGEWGPDVVVVDGSLGAAAVEAARRARSTVRVVAVGRVDGADLVAPTLAEVRDAILGLPGPGGPVRR
ncbi:MAG TPA: hypothetical protein VNO34_05790 [Actinomycetota bacterium]|nr:hypothetical protein [Actinomycetota bacterium]